MTFEIPAPALALIGLAMFTVPLAIAGIWAGNRAAASRERRNRESDEALYREVYGPGGKPGKSPGTGR